MRVKIRYLKIIHPSLHFKDAFSVGVLQGGGGEAGGEVKRRETGPLSSCKGLNIGQADRHKAKQDETEARNCHPPRFWCQPGQS